jgi:ribosomal protein S21
MIKLKRNTGENNEHLMRRFKKSVKEARFVNVLKKERYHKKDPTKTKIRAAALAREKYRSLRKKQIYLD